jgi:hypothetical protein
MLSLPPSENAFTSDLVFRRILECTCLRCLSYSTVTIRQVDPLLMIQQHTYRPRFTHRRNVI